MKHLVMDGEVKKLLEDAQKLVDDPNTPEKYRKEIQRSIDFIKSGGMNQYGNSYDDEDNCQEFNVLNM